MFRLESVKNGLPKDFQLSRREKFYLSGVSAFFAIIPTTVFIAISSDVIQIAVMTVPFVIAFMTIILSIDITFGLPTAPDMLEKLSKRREKFSEQLSILLRFSLTLILVTLVAKSLAIWLCNGGWLENIVNHFMAWTVGGLVAAVIIRLGDIRDIFGYLSVGADLGQRVRAMTRRDQ